METQRKAGRPASHRVALEIQSMALLCDHQKLSLREAAMAIALWHAQPGDHESELVIDLAEARKLLAKAAEEGLIDERLAALLRDAKRIQTNYEAAKRDVARSPRIPLSDAAFRIPDCWGPGAWTDEEERPGKPCTCSRFPEPHRHCEAESCDRVMRAWEPAAYPVLVTNSINGELITKYACPDHRDQVRKSIERPPHWPDIGGDPPKGERPAPVPWRGARREALAMKQREDQVRAVEDERAAAEDRIDRAWSEKHGQPAADQGGGGDVGGASSRSSEEEVERVEGTSEGDATQKVGVGQGDGGTGDVGDVSDVTSHLPEENDDDAER
jgi:hypothetical protein